MIKCSADLHGKKIHSILLAAGGPPELIWVDKEFGTISDMVYHFGFHGQYDDSWIIVLDKNGNELQRYNGHYVACITWAKEEIL
jgi:hypothetical protein